MDRTSILHRTPRTPRTTFKEPKEPAPLQTGLPSNQQFRCKRAILRACHLEVCLKGRFLLVDCFLPPSPPPSKKNSLLLPFASAPWKTKKHSDRFSFKTNRGGEIIERKTPENGRRGESEALPEVEAPNVTRRPAALQPRLPQRLDEPETRKKKERVNRG